MERRRSGLFALGRALARSGWMPRIAAGVAALTVFGVIVVAFRLVQVDEREALVSIPPLAANLLAWGAGILVAVAASMRAFRRDREEGTRDLLRARGCVETSYLWARVVGLAVALTLLVGGGTAVAGVVTALLAHGGRATLHVAQSLGASLVYAILFSFVLAPVSMATLAARSRIGGYSVLALVLIVPDVLKPWTAAIMPEGWADLGSIPGALMAARVSLSPGQVDLGLFARSVALLALVSALALLALRVEQSTVDREARAQEVRA
jgi:hypothetical protein